MDWRGVGVDRNSVPAGSCSYWLHTQLTQRLAVLVCPSFHTPPPSHSPVPRSQEQ